MRTGGAAGTVRGSRPIKGGAMGTSDLASSTDGATDATKPTIVLVHGAWADATGFDGSIRALRRQGYRAIAAANPLRELRSDAAYLAALLRSIEGPIVLVGHSYGGAGLSHPAHGKHPLTAPVYHNGGVADAGGRLH